MVRGEKNFQACDSPCERAGTSVTDSSRKIVPQKKRACRTAPPAADQYCSPSKRISGRTRKRRSTRIWCTYRWIAAMESGFSRDLLRGQVNSSVKCWSGLSNIAQQNVRTWINMQPLHATKMRCQSRRAFTGSPVKLMHGPRGLLAVFKGSVGGLAFPKRRCSKAVEIWFKAHQKPGRWRSCSQAIASPTTRAAFSSW
jgi:hypothetical protein